MKIRRFLAHRHSTHDAASLGKAVLSGLQEAIDSGIELTFSPQQLRTGIDDSGRLYVELSVDGPAGFDAAEFITGRGVEIVY